MPFRTSGSPPVRRTLSMPSLSRRPGRIARSPRNRRISARGQEPDRLRHAIGAADVAPIGDADPQVVVDPAEGVDQARVWSIHRGPDRRIGFESREVMRRSQPREIHAPERSTRPRSRRLDAPRDSRISGAVAIPLPGDRHHPWSRIDRKPPTRRSHLGSRCRRWPGHILVPRFS